MTSTSFVLTARRRAAVFVCGLVFALLAAASSARAAELLYWDNYSSDPDTIGVANADGSGASLLNLGGVSLVNPEGLAIDTAGARIFVASSGSSGIEERIIAVNLDGSGAVDFSAPGAPVDNPVGIAIDPLTRKVFWANYGNPEKGRFGSIAWAMLDGSAGGILSGPGITVFTPYRLAVDPSTGLVFWDNEQEEPERIAYGAEDGSSGGILDVSGATVPPAVTGFAVDSAAGRLYWLDSKVPVVSFANVGGGGGGDIAIGGAKVGGPYGLAIDPELGRLYWGNYNSAEKGGINAIGFSNLLGESGAISISGVPVAGPQDPVILKSPKATGAPRLTRSKGSRSKLQCSSGVWSEANPGGFVYQSPTTLSYAWKKNGKTVGGASTRTLNTKSAGRYTCQVTGTNQAGSASQVSKVLKVKAAKLKLRTKKEVKAAAGGVATFKLTAKNQGDLKSGKARICVKLAAAAKGVLRKPKCKKLGRIAGGKKKTTKVKIGVAASAAPGTYGLTFQVKGSAGKAAKAKVVVAG